MFHSTVFLPSVLSNTTNSLANKTSISTLRSISGVSGNWYFKISIQINGGSFRVRYLGNIQFLSHIKAHGFLTEGYATIQILEQL